MTATDAAPSPNPVSTGDGWTIDELAGLGGLTVRTTRYYASLGLLPPPERRGRIAYYDDRHRLRLEMIRTMQEQGFALAGIEQYLSGLDPDMPASELEIRRAMLSAWAPPPVMMLTRAELDDRAGRTLTEEEITRLERIRSVSRVDGYFKVQPSLEVGLGLLDLDIPVHSVEAAEEVIRDAMETMVRRLRRIMQNDVLEPYRERLRAHEDPRHFEQTVASLRQLTLEAVVAQFTMAATNMATSAVLAAHAKS